MQDQQHTIRDSGSLWNQGCRSAFRSCRLTKCHRASFQSTAPKALAQPQGQEASTSPVTNTVTRDYTKTSSASTTRRQLLQFSSATAFLAVTQDTAAPFASALPAQAAPAPSVVATSSALLATEAAAVASGVVERIDLAPGLNISRVIKGCWQLSGGHRGDRESDRTGGQAAVQDFDGFVAAGITTFDAADHYGPAEALIGRYLATHPEQAPPRTQVLTKYCVFGRRDMAGINKEAVRQAVNLSRSRLGVDRVDLMQFYWGDYDVDRYMDGALYLSELAAEGLIANVGVTNFDVPRMDAMRRAGVPMVSNQLQYSLLDRRPENGMADFCAQYGIAMLTYGVLAGGFLSDKYLGVPASKVAVDTYSKGKYSSVISAAGGWDWFQSLLKTLNLVAGKHSVSISNVAARWVLQRPGVAAIILGARNANHVGDQQRLFSFNLDNEDIGVIQEVLDAGRRPTSDCYSWERGGKW